MQALYTYAHSWILFGYATVGALHLQLTFEAVCQDSSKVSEELQGFECKHVEMVHISVSGKHRRSECQNVGSTISTEL